MTREIALHCMKSASELESELCEECPIYGQTGCDHCYEDALQYVIGMLEKEPVLDKIKSDITKFADTIPFNIGEVKAKYRNIGQHDGLEQALEIIEGNLKGDFDIDEWMAESEEV